MSILHNGRADRYVPIIFIFLITLSFSLYMYGYSKKKQIPEIPIIDTQDVSFRISDDQMNVEYQKKKTGQWQHLINISDIKRNNFDVLPTKAKKFVWVMSKPDKNKIIFFVCDNLINEDDHADHWSVIYNLKTRKQTQLPGNTFLNFSSDHQFVLTSDVIEALPGTTDYYISTFEEGKIIFFLRIDEKYAENGRFNKEIAQLLKAHGVIIQEDKFGTVTPINW